MEARDRTLNVQSCLLMDLPMLFQLPATFPSRVFLKPLSFQWIQSTAKSTDHVTAQL